MKNILEKFFIFIGVLFGILSILFVIFGLCFIVNYPFQIIQITIFFVGFSILSSICGVCLFFAIFKSYNRKYIISVPILLTILPFLIFGLNNNLQDLWFGPKSECGIFDSYDKEINYRRMPNKSYIFLQNSPKSVLFDI